MVKVNLTIETHEDKTSKGYDYTRFKCNYSDGSSKWMTAFKKTDDEKKLIEELKESEGKEVSVEVENTKDNYWNIKKFYGVISAGQKTETQKLADNVANAVPQAQGFAPNQIPQETNV